MTRIYLVGVCLLLLCWQSARTLNGESSADSPKPQPGQKNDKEEPNLLSMEVHALETLRNFRATDPQLQILTAEEIARQQRLLRAAQPSSL
jgi:hypothetical protein